MIVTSKLQVLQSKQDASVNWVEEQLVGFLESRYVRKCDEYLIGYLSSQTGCNRGCRMCHLTVTGQTSFTDVSHNGFLSQALQILKHYKNERKPAKYAHWNFMARGEVLANKVILESADELLSKLASISKDEGLPAKFNISTIMPATFKGSLVQTFPYITPTIYYSLYSLDETWRKKWLPGAMPVREALRLLKEYQDFSKKIVKIHHALIAGENDSPEMAYQIVYLLEELGIIAEYNQIMFNPASPEQGQESSPEARRLYMAAIRTRLPGKVQEIHRVGRDVMASCGTFFDGE